MNSRRQGSRVIQIPFEWPAREGAVLDVKSDSSATAILIGWDDGRQDWIEEEDIRSLRIWFISGEPMRELVPRPLEVQLSRLMEPELALVRLPRLPKGPL